MYDNEAINQFIHLRSQDFPLRTIAEKIGVPKSTLSDWEKRYYGDIQIARAEAWDQTEEDAAFTPQDDLKALLAIITTCQDELVRRRESMKTHELIRLMFAARRDYFRRRDAFMKPLNNLRNKSGFRTTLKLADRLKDLLGILPQIEAEREALSKTPPPDKTGQTTDKNPDTTPNPRNDNHFRPDKNPDNTPRELPTPVQRPKPESSAFPNQQNSTDAAAASHDSGTANNRSQALPLPRGEGRGEGQPGSLVLDFASPPNSCDETPSPKSNRTERSAENVAPEPHNTNDLQQPKPDSFDSVTPEVTRGLASSQSSENHNPPPADAVQDSGTGGEPDPNSQPSTLNFQADDDFLGSVVINPLECGAGVVLKCLEQEAAHRARHG